MNTFLNYLLSPLGCLAVFLLGIGYNIVAHVPAEGLDRLASLAPSLVVLVIWILTSSARNRAGK